MRRRFVLCSLLGLLALSTALCVSSKASAADYPEEYSQRPQTLPHKMLEITAGSDVELPAGYEPHLTLGFGVRMGLTDGFELGLAAAFTKVSSTLVTSQAFSGRGILWHSDTASLSLGAGLQLVGPSGPGNSALLSFVNLGFYTHLGSSAGLRIEAGVTNPLTFRDALVDTYGLRVEPSFNILPALATYVSLTGNAAFRDVETATGGAAVGLVLTIDKRFDFAGSFGMPSLVSRVGLNTDERVASFEMRWRYDGR